MAKPDKLFIAWLAGFVDGEGCIAIRTRTRKYSKNNSRVRQSFELKVTITNTDEVPLEEIKSYYGGTIYTKKSKNVKWKSWHVLALHQRKALALLQDISPYLRIKFRQAEVAFDYYKSVSSLGAVGKKGLPKKVWDLRKAMTNVMKMLNAKGIQYVAA